MNKRLLATILVCLVAGVFGFGHMLHTHGPECHTADSTDDGSLIASSPLTSGEVADSHVCYICTVQHISFISVERTALLSSEVQLDSPNLEADHYRHANLIRTVDTRGSPVV